MRTMRAAAILVVMLAISGAIQAADRGHAPWRSIGHNVSVRVWAVRGVRNTWSWDFRNDGSSTITYMTFNYVAYHPDGTTSTHGDIVPFDLRPGQAVGGWIAFAADSVSEPAIFIKQISTRGARASAR
jgi:hypothetical protein